MKAYSVVSECEYHTSASGFRALLFLRCDAEFKAPVALRFYYDAVFSLVEGICAKSKPIFPVFLIEDSSEAAVLMVEVASALGLSVLHSIHRNLEIAAPQILIQILALKTRKADFIDRLRPGIIALPRAKQLCLRSCRNLLFPRRICLLYTSDAADD